ncbi:MAG: hypothetical protein IBJ19_08945 [Gemmatimonadaceae bacterium]|nr:hypothetical protein [Gemmatimonadaceae bacterium]
MTELLDLAEDSHARRLLLLVALLMIVVPLYQVGLQLWPLQLTTMQWRYQAAGVLVGNLMLPFLGLSAMALVGRGLENKALSLATGVVAGLFALGLGASIVVYALDAQQLQAIVTSAMAKPFKMMTIRVAGVAVMFFVGFAYLTLVCFVRGKAVTAPSRRAGKASTEGDEDVGLIVGVRD